jgi:hypothetical protein
MQALQSYPVFEADQVLSNDHLNNLLNYLEQQQRLTRIKLIGRGIVCGLEINSSKDAISISKGCALTSQGNLMQLCESRYTHVAHYNPPVLPNDLYFIRQCEEASRENIPYYNRKDILELIEEGDTETESKENLESINLSDYVVILFLEATQTDLKNCDTQDCNDKGSRMDFLIKPLLVRRRALENPRRISFRSVLLKRFNVPVTEMNTSADIFQGFMNITDNATLTNLSQNLVNSWTRFAVPLGLPSENPLEGLNLIEFRNRISSDQNLRIFTQYFYDFIDDLLKAYIEFRSKVRDVFGECCPDEMDFPLHVHLGLASEDTLLGKKNLFRHYFESSPILSGQSKITEEAALLLERLVGMVKGFDIDQLSAQDPIQITPSLLGHENITLRAIPYYYDWQTVNPLWYFNRSYAGNERYNLGYRAAAKSDAPEPVKNPLLYDIERFDSFRIEGHIGKNYLTALREILGQKHRFNLPFDVIALNAIDLSAVLNGRQLRCHIEDLESDYRVMITGIVCQLQQILAYVADLRPRRTPNEDLLGKKTITSRDFVISKNLVEMQKSIRSDLSKNQNISISNAEIIQNLALKNAEPGEKLADFVGMDVSNFIVNFKPLFEYIIPQPDLLVIFMQQLAEIIKYLLANELEKFDEDSYNKLWTPYAQTVDKIIDEAANSKNEEIQRYFTKSNHELKFKCPNERLFALRDEYKNRLEQYHAAVNFNEYFKKHPGLEHKAGVPKGGTFVLVYHGFPQQQSIRPNLNIASNFTNIAFNPNISAREPLSSAINTSENISSLNKSIDIGNLQTTKKTEFGFAAELIRNMNLGVDASRVLEILKSRDQELRDQFLRIPRGTVIADFYLPYMCCSDCPPIAYVIPEEREPEPVQPSLSMGQTEFCENDRSNYPINAVPEGGVLSANGARLAKLEINPSQLGAGQFQLSYEVEGQKAELAINVRRFRSASVELSKVTFERETGWTLLLDPGFGNDEVNHIWRLNGNDLSDKGVLSQNFAMARGEAEISITVQNLSPCQPSTSSYDLEFRTQGVGICGRPKEFQHNMQESSDVLLVDSHPDVRVEGNIISFVPDNVLDIVGDSFTLPVYQRTSSGFLFTILAFTYLDASFRITFRQSTESGPPSRPPVNRGGLSVILNAQLPIGESTWTFNGEKTKPEFLISAVRLRELKEIVITHNIVINEFDCTDEKTFSISLEELAKRLASGNGMFEATV